MNEHTFYITVKVTVKSDLNKIDAEDDFASEVNYQFDNTDNCIVTETELVSLTNTAD